MGGGGGGPPIGGGGGAGPPGGGGGGGPPDGFDMNPAEIFLLILVNVLSPLLSAAVR